MSNQKHRIRAATASTILGWLNTRGGLLVWRSADLCDPCKSWTTPAKDEHGKAIMKPSWQAESQPARLITSIDEVEVAVEKEVRRFHVALRMGASGTRIKLTDASSEKLRKALDKAGPDSWYQFDYSAQEAVIFAPEKIIPLAEYVPQEVAS